MIESSSVMIAIVAKIVAINTRYLEVETVSNLCEWKSLPPSCLMQAAYSLPPANDKCAVVAAASAHTARLQAIARHSELSPADIHAGSFNYKEASDTESAWLRQMGSALEHNQSLVLCPTPCCPLQINRGVAYATCQVLGRPDARGYLGIEPVVIEPVYKRTTNAG
jgi:hypothetical protein